MLGVVSVTVQDIMWYSHMLEMLPSNFYSTSSVLSDPFSFTITTLARAHTHACSSTTLTMHGFAGDADDDDDDQRKLRVSTHSVITKPWHSRFVFHLKKVGATSDHPDASSLGRRLATTRPQAGVHACVPQSLCSSGSARFYRK